MLNILVGEDLVFILKVILNGNVGLGYLFVIVYDIFMIGKFVESLWLLL